VARGFDVTDDAARRWTGSFGLLRTARRVSCLCGHSMRSGTAVALLLVLPFWTPTADLGRRFLLLVDLEAVVADV